jgi:uncharacterized protein (TIGR03437 family)
VRVLVFLALTFSCFGASFSTANQPRVLAFEDRSREYVSHGPGYFLSVTSSEAMLNVRGHLLRMSVVGGNPESPLEALDRMPGKANYFLGSDVRASYDLYGAVRVRDVYCGIDLVFRANQERLEYDFEIGAGRDPARIKVDLEGADEIRIDSDGALILRAGAFEIRQPPPFAYQLLDGRKRPVRAAYRLDASHRVRFRMGPYDRNRPLVIDPQLVFENFFGGSGSSAAAVALDAHGNIYAAGSAQANAFVTKWSPDGSRLLYSTTLGGSGTDSATGLAVDGAGSVYVTGMTNSQDFPVTGNAFQKTPAGAPGSRNAFVSKLSPDGSQLVYSTLLGGGSEVTSRIAVDRAGQAVIAGGTNSATFPVSAGAFQSAPVAGCSIQSPFVELSGTAFVSKLAADGGSLVFSTLLGGSCATRAQAVAIDGNGNAWVGGRTDSPDFPVTQDAWQRNLGGDVYDGFLVRFDPGGALAYATYVGGPRYDTVTGVTFDQKGNVYLTGTSGGLSQPASPGAFQPQVSIACVIISIGPSVYQAVGSGFVLKLDPAAHTTLGLTYLGSPLCLFPSDIAVDASGAPWIAGPTSIYGSAPQTASPLQIGGSGFVSKFSADFTQLLFSTYFDAVSGIALDSAGLAYVAGVGQVDSATGKGQAYVAKIDPTPPAISLDAVQNAINPASPSSAQGIGPGELLRILGKNMGPAKATPGIINGGVLATTVAGVEVTFDGVAVPLLAVSATEIDLMAPFELAGKTATTVQVQYNGGKSNPVQVAVAGPIRFAGVVSGIPLQVLDVLNEDLTVNSASNPARAGSVMTLYVSGAGQTVPPSQDGQVNSFPPAAAPEPVQIGPLGANPNNPANVTITFAGAAPGLVAGIFQINFVAPQQSVTNLTLIMGQAVAQFDVFVGQ